MRSEKTPGFRDRWLKSVYQHARVRPRLAVAAFLGQQPPDRRGDRPVPRRAHLAVLAARARLAARSAKAILEREALAQNAPDGVNREQAVAYQQFVLEMLLLPPARRRARTASASRAAYEARIEAMLDFLASIMDAGGNLPMFGDADDGRAAAACEPGGFAACRSLLATGAILFGRGDFKLKAGALDDTHALAARRAAPTRSSPRSTPRRPGCRCARPSPRAATSSSAATSTAPSEIRLVADAGPLGYRSIAAHGHADALSFTLSAGGRELLVDPGTYAYHTHPAWRHYFRGTGAHNTLRVDGLDQSVPGGNFMWLAKARAGCSLWLSSADKDSFEGWHDGYMRARRPGEAPPPDRARQAQRAAWWSRTRWRWSEDHEVELFFHCSELCSVERGRRRRSWFRSRTHRMKMLPAAARAMHRRNSTRAAWRRSAAGSRAPSTGARPRRPSSGARG